MSRPDHALALGRALALLRVELDELAHMEPGPHGDFAPYALFGSVVMVLHGLPLGQDRQVGDVDVFVSPWIWEQLAGRTAWVVDLPDPADPPYAWRGIGGLRICAFYRWTAQDPEVNADHCRLYAKKVHGCWCAPLEVVRLHKAMAIKHGTEGRFAKHIEDTQIIGQHLRG